MTTILGQNYVYSLLLRISQRPDQSFLPLFSRQTVQPIRVTAVTVRVFVSFND